MVALILVFISCALYPSAESKAGVVIHHLPDVPVEHHSDHHQWRRQAVSLMDTLSGMDYHLQYKKSNCVTKLAEEFIKVAEGASNRPSGMTIDEYASIRLYTYSKDDCPFYRDFNTQLWQVKGKSAGIFQAYIDLLRSALSKLPVYRGELWRGISEGLYSCPVDQTLPWYGFSSTSLDRTESAKRGKLYKITNGQGYSISKLSYFPSEKEILLPPGINFKVRSQESEYCVLEQLTSVSGGCRCAQVYLCLSIVVCLHVIVTINRLF